MSIWPIIRLSWKNIWRNKTRSAVVIIAVILGTWAGTFMAAFMNGMVQQQIETQLDNYIAHIQIHTKKYQEDELPKFYIHSADSLLKDLQSKPFVSSITARSVITGLASSSASTFGVTITGVYPETEKTVSELYTTIKEGNYFEGNARNQIVIGEKLATRLKLRLRSKIVLNFQDVNGTISAGAFRVAGIYKSTNTSYDESHVYVRIEDLNRLIGNPDAVHEIAMKIDNIEQADTLAAQIGNLNPTLSVESWGDISTTLRYASANMDTYLYIIMVIILIALTFGIINTMLMAVLERQQEIGMLMAIGVNKARTFSMILSETFFLAIFGAPIGLFLAWIGIHILSSTGVDVSAFAAGLEEYGYSSVIYPILEADYYLNVGILIIITTLVAAIYPSYKALKLNPVEAIRKI